MSPIKFVAALGIATQLISSVPVAFAMTAKNDYITAPNDRCTQLSGREKSRCLTVTSRTSRLHLRQVKSKFDDKLTWRTQRVLVENLPATDVRKIGNIALKKQLNDARNFRSKREIRTSAITARNDCSSKTGTEKYLCVRKNWDSVSRPSN